MVVGCAAPPYLLGNCIRARRHTLYCENLSKYDVRETPSLSGAKSVIVEDRGNCRCNGHGCITRKCVGMRAAASSTTGRLILCVLSDLSFFRPPHAGKRESLVEFFQPSPFLFLRLNFCDRTPPSPTLTACTTILYTKSKNRNMISIIEMTFA